MKASRYNIFFDYKGSKIGFNSYTQEYILLDPVLIELYNVGLSKGNYSELKEVHPELYAFLGEQGFLVPNDLDEFERVKELSKKIDNDDTSFHLIINPTMNCNFKCWYCYETHIKDSKMDQTTIESTKRLIDKVIKTQKNIKSFHLSFFGGEPLLYFDKVIAQILPSAYELCANNHVQFTSSMTTNGLLINDNVIDISKKYGLRSFQITLDGNKEQHNKIRFISEERGSYNKIISNIILLAKANLIVNLRINCSPETFNGINEICKDLEVLSDEERSYINVDFHKVWQIEEDLSLELDITRDFFKKNGFQTSPSVSDSLVNSCYGDKRYQATLNYNGEVFKCTARDFKDNSGEGYLLDNGTIEWNERYEKRLNIKFENPPCKECVILPICGGGCTQQALENEGQDYCIYNFDEEEKKKQVIKKFEVVLSDL